MIESDYLSKMIQTITDSISGISENILLQVSCRKFFVYDFTLIKHKLNHFRGKKLSNTSTCNEAFQRRIVFFFEKRGRLLSMTLEFQATKGRGRSDRLFLQFGFLKRQDYNMNIKFGYFSKTNSFALEVLYLKKIQNFCIHGQK